MTYAAAVVPARHSTCLTSIHHQRLPVAPSQYWNSVHGRFPGEAAKDTEGLQTMRTLARNMAFLLKSIALGKQQYGLPEKEEWAPMNFVR